MLCTSRDDVLEDDVNVWSGEETADFQPKYDVICVHGLGSHPYWAWLHEPSPRVSRVDSASSWDSAVSLIPQNSRWSRFRIIPGGGGNSHTAPFVPNNVWANDFSNTDALGRVGTFWPRDLLSLDLPEARVCTLGYRSQWTSTRFQTSFKECGEHLLTVLERSRQSSSAATTRPIIFIAHSFGGLVVQSALLTARMDDKYSSINSSVAGCLFLGCPFGGSDGAAYLNMATHVSGNYQGILNSLRPGNNDLWTLQNEFLRCYRELPLVCFYEKIKSGLGRTMMIVPESSARILGKKAVALYKDHSGLNKFESFEDESYAQVLSELKSMLKADKGHGRHGQHFSHWYRRDGDGTRNQLKRLVKDKVSNHAHAQKFRGHRMNRSMSADYQLESDANTLTSSHNTAELSSNLLTGRAEPISVTTPNLHPVSISETRSRIVTSPPILSVMNGSHGVLNPGQRNGNYIHYRGTFNTNTRGNRYAPSPGNLKENHGPHSFSRAKTFPSNLPPHLLLSYQALQEEKGPGHSDRSNVGEDDAILSPRQPETHSNKPQRLPTGHFRSSKSDRRLIQSPTSAKLSLSPQLVSESKPSALLKDHASGSLDRIAPLRYLQHLEQVHERAFEPDVCLTRKDILERLMSNGANLMSSNRVALTGPLGIGKTCIAIDFVSQLCRQSENTSIFWVSAETEQQLYDDCNAITKRMDLKPPKPDTKPWDWLCKILRRISSTASGSWAMVLDGVVPAAKVLGIHKFCETPEGKHGYILMTTRHLDIAERFTGETGVRIDVGTLDTSHAANLLGQDASVPASPVFDELAQFLGFDPLAIMNVKGFLRMTAMLPRDYADRLGYILGNVNWAKGSMLARIAKVIINGGRADSGLTPADNPSESLAVLSVLRSCINPSWYILFDQLESEQPTAVDLLSLLSAFGRPTIPNVLLPTNAAITGAANVLIDRSILISKPDYIEANRIMLMAHRVWLIGHDRLECAHKSALQTIACEYPDAAYNVNWSQCETLEPFAKVVLTESSQSWIQADHTSRGLKVMLLQKRSKFLRVSGTNVGESKDMMDAEVTELKAIHGLDSQSTSTK